MATFERAIDVVLAHEGGFVNNPNDPGGATNYGISIRFLQQLPVMMGDLDHDGDIDVQDIRNMMVGDAKRIYKQFWWDKFRYSDIKDQTIATKVFDFAVNMGAKRAHILLQRTLNNLYGLRLTVDGVLGNATISVVNAVSDLQEQQLLNAYCDEAWKFYKKLMIDNPKLKVFAKGWRNRAYSLRLANSIS